MPVYGRTGIASLQNLEIELNKFDVIVVGGGAAGLLAAGEAATAGARTAIIEKMSRPGRKLRITGKGRCNLTNIAPVSEFIDHFGKNGRFLRQAFHQFFSDDLVAFFKKLGVVTVVERGGRVFPADNQAQRIVDALVQWNHNSGVRIISGTRVIGIYLEKNAVTGVMTIPAGIENKSAKATFYQSKSVVIATGGSSYPGTGSTGDGYRFAADTGHTIADIRPALVPLEVAGEVPNELQGLKLRNVSVTMFINDKKNATEFGELEFTPHSVSGPIILTLSKIAVDALRAGQKVLLTIDLKPALDHKKLDVRLLRDLAEFSNKSFHIILKRLLPVQLIPVCIKQTKIPGDTAGHQITAEQRKQLRMWLKNFKLEITRSRPIEEALVTAGGVKLSEVNPRTMASKLVEGLFFAGEVLDLDADTGGYNLQAAFSTGWLAGTTAVKYSLPDK